MNKLLEAESYPAVATISFLLLIAVLGCAAMVTTYYTDVEAIKAGLHQGTVEGRSGVYWVK